MTFLSERRPGLLVLVDPSRTEAAQAAAVARTAQAAGAAAVMIGDAAYTSRIFQDADHADLSKWRGQAADHDSGLKSLHRVRDMKPHAVHFCHDTSVLHP